MRRSKKTVVAAAALLVFCSATVWAGSLETLGASSRGTSMGGAMISIARGWEAAYYNPSGLALSRDSAGVQLSNVSGELLINEENSLGGGAAFKFGINHRFWRDRVGVGLIVGQGLGGGGGISLDIGALTGGGAPNWNWAMYSDSLPILLSTAVAFRVTNWLAFGITFQEDASLVSLSNYPLVVDPILEQLIGISTGVVPSNVQGYSFSAGADPDSDFVTAFNVSLNIGDYVSLGYLYQPETWARYKLRIELVGGEGSLLPQSQFIMIDMEVPGQVETVVYGAAGHIPIPWNDGTLTVAWEHETQYWEGFYARSVQYQWDADEVFIGEFFTDPQPEDPGLEDIDIDRYGLEYEGDAGPLMFAGLKKLRRPRFFVRGGYYQWESPQPDATYSYQVAMVDADADVYSFGLGFSWDRKRGKRAVAGPDFPPTFQIDLHFQQIDLEDRTFDLHPDSFGGIPLENYFVNTEGHMTNMGVQFTWWR